MIFFFCKQKTAYEMRISDWSSDVCSSDLAKVHLRKAGTGTDADVAQIKSMEDAIEKAASRPGFTVDISFVDVADADTFTADVDPSKWEAIGRAAGRERVCQYM